MKRVLVVSTTAVGDTLLGTPAIRAIKESYPNIITDMIVHTKKRDIVKANPYIDNLYCYRNNYFIRQFLYLILSFKRYDYIIILHSNKDILLLLKKMTYKKIITEQQFSDEGLKIKQVGLNPEQHIIERRLQLVKTIGAKTKNKTMDIFFSHKSEKTAEKFFTREGIKKNDLLIGLQPGAAHAHRRWSIDNFTGVIDYLKKKYHAKFVINASKEEVALYKDLVNPAENGVFLFTGALSTISFIIKRCNIFITADTGPMHIAFAAGTKTVALFCPTDPLTLGPYCSKTQNIIINKTPPCTPCVERKCRDPFCMSLITVKEVNKACDRLLLAGK